MPVCRPIIKIIFEYGEPEYINIKFTICRKGYERTYLINERQVVGIFRNIKRWRWSNTLPNKYTLENPNVEKTDTLGT